MIHILTAGLLIIFFHRYSIFYSENVCSKQFRGYFLVYSLLISFVRLMLYYRKMYSKQAWDCILVYYATFLIEIMCVGSKWNLAFYFINFSNIKLLLRYQKYVFKVSETLPL